MQDLPELIKQAKNLIEQANNIKSLEQARVVFLGKNGLITKKLATLSELPPCQRPRVGKVLNQIKQSILSDIDTRKKELISSIQHTQIIQEELDVTLPGRQYVCSGGSHPITLTIERIENFFEKLGFSTVFGPEVEDAEHNFDALNIPKHHPTRTEHDTFWFDSNRLLRSQTSNVQIRVMKEYTPPIRIIAPGRVYRNDFDQTHTPMFHQVEGLMVDNHLSFAQLKSILYDFLHYFFEYKHPIRFRPSYFPFTEPSVEVDIQLKDGKWLEVLGAGMVHPNVFCNVGIDPKKYSGLAFGMGVERLAMLRYGIDDLRNFYDNDLRFLTQFVQVN